MKTQATTLLAMVLTLTCSASDAAAEAPPPLSNNPFSRPPSEMIRIDRGVITDDDAAGQPLPLQATMIGRSNRLANVAGRILKPGDEYQGYRLVAIHEQYAVFERDGRDIAVYVKPLLAEDNEQDN